MLSKKSKYAIKALLALAEHRGEEPVRIADLARDEQLPAKFLELILLDLGNHGILQSRKGKGGGYLLARDPATSSWARSSASSTGRWPRFPAPPRPATSAVRTA